MDESFRDVLPFFRPQSQDVSWVALTVFGMMLVVVTGSYLMLAFAHRRQRRGLWKNFYATAEERGLNSFQRSLLAEIARRERIRNPLLLLGSLRTFDRYVGERAAILAEEKGREAKQELEGTIAGVACGRRYTGTRPGPVNR